MCMYVLRIKTVYDLCNILFIDLACFNKLTYVFTFLFTIQNFWSEGAPYLRRVKNPFCGNVNGIYGTPLDKQN